MELAANPFFILRVGTQHTRQEIIDAAEALALASDDDDYARARAVLTHPRNRIGAEMGWLPGVAPKLALILADRIKKAPQAISEALPKLPPLARCNIAAALLTFHPVKNVKLAHWLRFIAEAYEEIDIELLTVALNEDRAAAGFSAIPSAESLEGVLAERRAWLAEMMRDALDKIAEPDAIMTTLVDKVTASGTKHAPVLIDELLDKYQIEVQKYLDKLNEQIRLVLGTIHAAPKLALDNKLSLVEKKVRAWGKIARPIQISMYSKGLDDEASKCLAGNLRNAAVVLANEHDLHREAARITALLAQVFKELPLFSQALNEDTSALKEIMSGKERDKAEWERDIRLLLEMGTFFKDEFSINGSAIRFNKIKIRTGDVDRVRWGTFTKYVNGIKSSAKYTIWIGSPKHSICIECTKLFQSDEIAERNYQRILEKLWPAVCNRLVKSALMRLSTGEKIRYGNVVVDKNGITITRNGWFDRPYRAKWEEVQIGNGNGTFVISSCRDQRAVANLAYREVDNLPILEAVLKFLSKDGNIGRLQDGEFK